MCFSARAIWNIVAVCSMLLSCGLVAASVTSLLAYYCSFNPGVSAFQYDNNYLTYIVYFYNSDCKDEQSNFAVSNSSLSERTWGWTIAYLVLNSVWFITSLLLLQGQSYWKTTSALWLTYPWIITTFGVLCTDAAASVMYGLDYQNLQTWKDLTTFIGLNVVENGNFEYYPVSTVIMVGIFSKGLVGWAFVFICFIAICVILRNEGRISEDQLILQTSAPFDYYAPSVVNPAYQDEMTEISSAPVFEASGNIHSSRFRDNPYWNNQGQMIPRITPRFPHDARNSNRTDQSLSRESSWEMADHINSETWNQQMQPTTNRYSAAEQQYGQRPWSYLPPSQRPNEQQYAYGEQTSLHY